MIGEEIDETKLNMTATVELLAVFNHILNIPKPVFAIAGESGSGKTYFSVALQQALQQQDKSSVILHMDDFFYLPPNQNHQQRVANIEHVGPQEVNLNRLNRVVMDFKQGEPEVVLPQVHYYEDRIEEITQSFMGVDALIVEGTYAFYLENTDFHLFMSRNYLETREMREFRNRGKK